MWDWLDKKLRYCGEIIQTLTISSYLFFNVIKQLVLILVNFELLIIYSNNLEKGHSRKWMH